MTTGARRGEICGLRWSHMDLDHAMITIRRIVSLTNTAWAREISPTKARSLTIVGYPGASQSCRSGGHATAKRDAHDHSEASSTVSSAVGITSSRSSGIGAPLRTEIPN
jgi:hypothetical protein